MQQEYGEVMRFLLHFRERYDSDETFRDFLLASLRELVRDLRNFDVIISIQPECLRRPTVRTEKMDLPESAKRVKATVATITPDRGG
jgi:hypothetical protein